MSQTHRREPGTPAWQAAYDQHLATIREGITANGWMIQAVFGTEEGDAPFAYTIGLIQQGAPFELLIAGLPPEVAGDVLNALCKEVLDNRFIPPADFGLTPPHTMKPVFLSQDIEPFSVGVAKAYYQSNVVPVVQYVWTDDEGHFPWDEGWPADVYNQPVGGSQRL